MNIMGKQPETAETEKTPEKEVKNKESEQIVPKSKSETEKTDENIFSQDNLPKDSVIGMDAFAQRQREITIDVAEKIAFIDAAVNNTRFTKDYTLFGGKVSLTLRSLTNDEVNALSSWIIKKGSDDSAGLMSGRYRKYLAAAQVAKFNGTEMPPLENPLFETLSSDGKTVTPPGWTERCAYWDNMAYGLFNAIISCISDFDARYSVLCQKANDANFWNPDTP